MCRHSRLPDGVLDVRQSLSGQTRRLGILGWPVAHSLSPRMHNAILRGYGMDALYVLLPTPPDRLPGVIRDLLELGYAGANVTVPHKVAVVGLCDRLETTAELVGAVNTLIFAAGEVIGANTDVAGHQGALIAAAPGVAGEPALVFGTGGAARAVVVGLAATGAPMTIVGRRTQALDDLRVLAERAGAPKVTTLLSQDDDGFSRAVDQATVVVNTTPLGMHGESLPSAMHGLRDRHVASDVVYAPSVTPFVRDARSAGAVAIDGRSMLAGQAALAFARWHGREVGVEQFLRALDGRLD